jgi:hypothetical protein
MLFDMSYGRYCVPIVKEAKFPVVKDSLGKEYYDTSFKVK